MKKTLLTLCLILAAVLIVGARTEWFDTLIVSGGYGSTGATITAGGAVSTNGDMTIDGTITVNGVRTVYVPNQTTLIGDLVYGNGGNSLLHTEDINPSGNYLNGYYNTFVGINAGFFHTIGNFCTYVGSSAGASNTTGEQNTFIGGWAGVYNTTGSWNTFLGTGAGQANTTGVQNTFLGCDTGLGNTTGSWNTFLGGACGSTHITGDRNTFIGHLAGALDQTGVDNLAIGFGALTTNIAGTTNTAIGTGALGHELGSYNLALGYRTLYEHQTGLTNTGIGTYALQSNLTGSGNTALGFAAGYYEMGSNAFYLGNVLQTNTANDKAYSLLYGTFAGAAGTLVGQTLKCNGDFSATTLAGPLTGTASNASQLLGATWAAPAALGSVTPNTVAGTTLTLSGATINTSTIHSFYTEAGNIYNYASQAGTTSGASSNTYSAYRKNDAGALKLYGGLFVTSPVITAGAEVGKILWGLMGGVTAGAVDYAAMELASTGLTLQKDLTVTGGDTTNGVNGTTRGTLKLEQGAGGNTPGYVEVHSPNGTAWFVFVEDDGTLKVHNAAPAANANGSVVGSQS